MDEDDQMPDLIVGNWRDGIPPLVGEVIQGSRCRLARKWTGHLTAKIWRGTEDIVGDPSVLEEDCSAFLKHLDVPSSNVNLH